MSVCAFLIIVGLALLYYCKKKSGKTAEKERAEMQMQSTNNNPKQTNTHETEIVYS